MANSNVWTKYVTGMTPIYAYKRRASVEVITRSELGFVKAEINEVHIYKGSGPPMKSSELKKWVALSRQEEIMEPSSAPWERPDEGKVHQDLKELDKI